MGLGGPRLASSQPTVPLDKPAGFALLVNVAKPAAFAEEQPSADGGEDSAPGDPDNSVFSPSPSLNSLV